MPLRRALGLADAPWGSFVDVRENAAEILATELVDRPPRPIKLCPIVSDPYHAIERRERLTRACLQTIADVAPATPVLVLTRSDAILDDLDVLARLPHAWAGMSIPTADADVLAHFEPRAPGPARRREVLAALCSAGIRTFAVAQPMLPGDVAAHVELLRGVTDSVSLDVLRGVEAAQTEFADPRWAMAARDDWQCARAHALREALERAGIEVWTGELPPQLLS
jgi:DNA repair photolyase